MTPHQRQQAKRARRAARAAKDQKAQQRAAAQRSPGLSERPIYTPEQLAQMKRLLGSAREVVVVARPERGRRILEELGHPSNVKIDSSIWEM